MEARLRARRSRCGHALAAFIVLFLAANAGARVMEWQGTVSLELIGIPVEDPLSVEGSGVAAVNPGGLSLQWIRFGGGISGTTTFIVTDPEAAAGGIVAVQAAPQLGSGTLPVAATPTLFEPLLSERVLPLRGAIRFCVLSTGCTSFLPLFLNQPTTVNGVPGTGSKGVGVGGLITAGGYGPVRISLEAAPWTLGNATVTVFTPYGGSFELATSGSAHGPYSFTGSTALTGGQLSLVTPMLITSSGFDVPPATFGRLTLRLVPEPGLLLLLASGVACLWILSKIRRGGEP